MSTRHGGGGGTGPLLVVLGLGAVLAGLVYAFWDQIRSRLVETPPPPEVVVKDSERKVELPPEEKSVETARREPDAGAPPAAKPAAARAEPSVLDRERKEADDIRRRADEALKAMDFRLAEELFGREADALRNDAQRAERARALATKAGTFRELMKDVKPSPAAASGMVTLKMHSGNDIVNVALIDETDDAYRIARRGMQFDVPRHQVRAVARMSAEEQRERLLREFEALEQKTAASSGADCFALADRAYRDGLNERALGYLEKAYAKDGADLPRQIRVAEAKKLLRLAIWCECTGRTGTAKIYCNKVIRLFADLGEQVADARELLERLSKPVAVADYKSTVKINVSKAPAKPSTAEEVAPQDEEATVVTEKVSSGSAKNEKLMGEINTLFDQAMDHYVKGRPGNPDSNKHLHQAATLFDKVVGLCDQALRNDPRNSQIESRQADASRYAYHSRKMSTL